MRRLKDSADRVPDSKRPFRPPPADAGECRFVDTSSKTKLVVNYAGADAGKAVFYLARWKSSAGDFGPWSETVVATVGA